MGMKKLIAASVLSIPLISNTSFAERVNLKRAFDEIDKAKNTSDLHSLYKGDPDISGAVKTLNQAIKGQDDREDWANKWAAKLRDGKGTQEEKDEVENLNSYRSLCIELFKKGVDLARKEAMESEDLSKFDHIESEPERKEAINLASYDFAEEQMKQFISDFGEQKIINLLHIAMLMDKSQALIKMVSLKDPNLVGAPWVSEIQMTDTDISPYSELVERWGNAPMNKRYKALTYNDTVMAELGYLLEPELPMWALAEGLGRVTI